MGKPKAPTPPSPQATAQAQTQSNRDTAITQAGLNATNQITPWGSLTYTQDGKWPDGTPKFTATTALTPEQQQLFATGQQTSQNLANLGLEQSSRLSGLLAEPFSLDNEATEARLMELGSKRLDPMLDRRRESEITRLANQGIKVGSTAYDRAMENLSFGESDAYNQLLLTGRNQAVQEALLQRQQPINEIIGLASGTQLQSPQFTSTPQTGVAGTDVAGITQQGYANQLGQYNMQQQQLGGMFGTLGNVAAAALPFVLSDRRAKTDIRKVGTTNDGQNLYSYRYKGSNVPQIGLMAQEVAKTKPEAVTRTLSGLLAVNYDKALEAA